MNLNEHGAACRCLLRLRENDGKPGMSDAAFIARFATRFPEWQARPGIADPAAIAEIAQTLGLAERIESFAGYDEILREHRAGRSILISTERVPEQLESSPTGRRYVMLLGDMDEAGFTVWCPYPSGQSGELPRAGREWWARWDATGIVLYRTPVASAPAGAL